MSSVGAVLTGVSIACIVAGTALLLVQVRRRPVAPVAVAPPSGNGSSPPAPPARGAASRRRIVYALLLAMVATLGAALVVQERLAWGVHLLADDAFLGYVAWLARRAETRGRAPAPTPEPAVEKRATARRPTAGSEVEEDVTDVRA
jgi:hypothetical protein